MAIVKLTTLFVVLLMILHANSYVQRRALATEFLIEHACASQGGMCVHEKECPDGLLTSTKGLCPEQQAKGAECCYGISKNERRCRQRGGECAAISRCGKAPKDTVATDCNADQVCCIWI